MGGVDLLDMLSGLYKYSFKTRRWYLYIWWHSISVALINAWSLCRRDLKALHLENNTMPLRRFQAPVGFSLVSAGKASVRVGRPLSSPTVSPPSHSPPAHSPTPPPQRRWRSTSVPPDVRRDVVNHFSLHRTLFPRVLWKMQRTSLPE